MIGDRPLDQLVPLYRDTDNKESLPATQFNMKWVETAGLVKFDFLGLKTLTVIGPPRDRYFGRSHPDGVTVKGARSLQRSKAQRSHSRITFRGSTFRGGRYLGDGDVSTGEGIRVGSLDL